MTTDHQQRHIGEQDPNPRAVPLARVGKYRVDEVIGRGAVGVVYRGYDELIDRPLAIKTLRPEVLSEMGFNSEILKRFAAEARSAGRCLHPNIVTVFDYVEHDGAPYIIMEYVNAGTLDNVIKSGALLPIQQVGEIMNQLLMALEHAHANGIIHRDIKPANILCPSATTIKVGDFGVAHIESLELTRTHGVSAIGTPNYMAPERFLGRPADARSDLFSAAVILYQLLTGTKPFVAADMPELVRKLTTQPPPPLTNIRTDLPAAFDHLVKKALSRNPDDRFQSASAFIEGINAAIDTLGSAKQLPMDLTKYSSKTPKDPAPHHNDTMNQTMAERLGGNTLEALERSLARSLGPIARLVLRKASQEATTTDILLTSLSRNFKIEADATRFRAEAERLLRDDLGVAGVQLDILVTAGEIDDAIQLLLPILGPMARVLVNRTAKTAVGREDFYERLASHVTKPADRKRLLALQGPPRHS
jgi:eukaryotic-like serine/threonine-protein kinase